MSIINEPKKPTTPLVARSLLGRRTRLSSLLVLPGGHRTRKHTDSLERLAARALRVVPKLVRPTPQA